MRYVCWHVGREGSNMLMSMLAQTGVAGIANYERAGFHVGYKNQTIPQFKENTRAFFKMQETPNGVQGCKAGFTYVDNIRKFTKTWEAPYWWIKGFHLHFKLSRRDKVAQAVSAYFAGHTKRWTSESTSDIPNPPYDYHAIAITLTNVIGEEARRDAYLTYLGIEPYRLWYEDICANPERSLTFIINRLNIPERYIFKQAIIQKQIEPLKREYINRFRAESPVHEGVPL